MATKQVGEFSSKFTTFTISHGPVGCILIQANAEGTATGLGTTITTATFVGAKSGTYGSVGVAALDNGESLTSNGSGTFDTVGKHRWRTQGCLELSDGRTVMTDGELDLANRSWHGRLFEKEVECPARTNALEVTIATKGKQQINGSGGHQALRTAGSAAA